MGRYVGACCLWHTPQRRSCSPSMPHCTRITAPVKLNELRAWAIEQASATDLDYDRGTSPVPHPAGPKEATAAALAAPVGRGATSYLLAILHYSQSFQSPPHQILLPNIRPASNKIKHLRLTALLLQLVASQPQTAVCASCLRGGGASLRDEALQDELHRRQVRLRALLLVNLNSFPEEPPHAAHSALRS